MAQLIRNRWFQLGATLFALAGLFVAIRTVLARPEPDMLTVAVERGPFELYVNGSAQLDARRSVTLSSELPSNTAKIISLVPEGNFVKRGDLVVGFDPAPFEADVRKLEGDLSDARAALAQAEAELQLLVQTGRQSQADAVEAVSALELRLRSLNEAERPLRLAQARNEVVSKRAAYARAREELAAQKEMFEAGFGSRAMVDEAQAAEVEAQNSLELAEQTQAVLERVSLPGELKAAQLELASKKRQREGAEQVNLQQLAKQNALLLRLRSAVADLDASVAAARVQLDRTRIAAPVSGFVVYKKIPVGGENRKVQIGDSVWSKNGFIVIPDMSALIASVNVPEQEVGRVAAGQPVRLVPDAYPGLELAGSVQAVGTLASDAAGQTGSGGNEFQVRIAVQGVDARLRPGMRASVAIRTGQYDDVLKVPVEAVFFERGKPVCFVWAWGAPRRRAVQLGDSDGSHVIVASGLRAGERLLLSYPSAAES